jgi:O-antigen ligase
LTTLLATGAAIGLALGSSRIRRVWGWSAVGILCVAIVFSGSRAALIGLGVLAVTLFWLAPRVKFLLWGFLVLVVIALFVSLGVIRSPASNAVARLLGENPTAVSDQTRERLREETIRDIEAHPITGVGFGVAKTAHMVYLQAWAAAGLLGLAGLGGLIVGTARMVRNRDRADLLLAGAIASYVAYLVTAVIYNALWDRYIWLFVALVVGLFKCGLSSRSFSRNETRRVALGRGPNSRSEARQARPL